MHGSNQFRNTFHKNLSRKNKSPSGTVEGNFFESEIEKVALESELTVNLNELEITYDNVRNAHTDIESVRILPFFFVLLVL